MRIDEKSSDQVFIAGQFIKEKNYWIKKLSGDLVKSSFPYSHKNDAVNFPPFDKLKFRVADELFESLMQICGNSDIKLYVFFVASLCVLLKKYMYKHTQDILIGAPIFKQDTEQEFVNKVLVLRNQPGDRLTFKELLLQVNQTLIEAVEHQNYPIETLLYRLDLQSEKDQDGFPLFDVAVILETIHDEKYLQHVNPNVIFSFVKGASTVEGTIKYNPSRYEKAAVERIALGFLNLLQRVIFNIETEIIAIDVLSEKEKRQLLFEFNGKEAAYPASDTIDRVFERQVKKWPDRVSVVFADIQLSYQELHKRSDRLSFLLKRKGITPGAIVALLFAPSVEMIVGILGVLKTGSAYLPIDPEYPRERMQHILDDSQPAVILTDDESMRKHSYNNLRGIPDIRVDIQRTAHRPQIPDINSLPFPDRSLVNYEKYNRFIGLALVKNSVTLHASRGCPYNCAFCHKIWPKSHVFRSAQNIFEEVKLYYDMGVRRFSFADDIFNLERENSTRFFRLVIENGLDIQIFFPNGIRGDILTKDYIDLMVHAGTTGVALALETASPRLQQLIGKRLNLKKFRENVEYIASTYPDVVLELFTMLGFPTETEEEALMTLDFIKSIKWIDFPIVSILKIYPNTDMERIALENGISCDAIYRSQNLAYHELPETLPFDKDFVAKYQSDFLNDYFLSKERLLHVLPNQMKRLAEDELVQKYNSYLPVDIKCFDDLLGIAGISKEELRSTDFFDESRVYTPGLNEKMKRVFFKKEELANDSLRILLLDLSQLFSGECEMLYDVVEAPLGLINILTYLKQEFGSKITGKIAKSRIDFNSFEELRTLLHEFEPDVIGLRTLTFFKDFFHKAVLLIRQWGFDVPILTGGPYATSDYETILRDSNIDLIVLGEGEITAAELVRAIMANGGNLPEKSVLKEIAGIVFAPGGYGAEKRKGREIIVMDEEREFLPHKETGDPLSLTRPDDIAYIIYTSGTTGKPKGLLIEHRNVLSLMFHENFLFDFSNRDTWTLFHSYNFDFSVWEMFGALLYGGKLIVLPKIVIKDPWMVMKMLKKQQVTVLNQTPLAFYNLVEEEITDKNKSLGIRYVIFGGDMLNPARLVEWQKKYPQTKLINMYGITETTVHVTFKQIGHEEISLNSNSIGKPLPTLNTYVLDSNLDLLPLGVPGEIFVGGRGVGRGYLNRIELTAEKFMENPHKDGQRLYKSGDLATVFDNGEIGYLGRIDNQVQIRGYRVELGEIEDKFLKIGDIEDALVVAGMEKTGERYLCAYFVSHKVIVIPELKEMLMQKLPHYMIPSYIVHLDEIPLTANGKIDRKSLPDPARRNDNDYMAPRNVLEKKLARIFSEILNLDESKMGIDSDFFESGGHSIKAFNLISKIHKELNVKIPINELFEKPTVRELAGLIKKVKREKFESIKAVEKKQYYPLSSAQGRTFYLQQMMGGTPFNLFHVIKLSSAVSKKQLEFTFKKLINRHEAFRTTIEFIKENPAQRILEKVDFEIEYHELSDQDGESLENRIEEISENFVRPFDFCKAPFIRAGLIKTGMDNSILMVDIHHIVSDFVSMDITVRDFMALDKGEILPPLRLQYKDFSEWQNNMKKENIILEQENFWLDVFSGDLPRLNLPLDFPRPKVLNFMGDRVMFLIKEDLTKKIRHFISKSKVTLNFLLFSIYSILLSKFSGQEDIVIGSPIVGRSNIELRKVVGMIANLVALRLKPVINLLFKDFLLEVKMHMLDAFENQDYQFEELIGKLKIKIEPNRQPLVETVLVFYNPTDERSNNDSSSNEASIKLITSNYDLYLSVVEKSDEIKLEIVYSTELFKSSTIEMLAKHFIEILEQVLDNDEILLKDIVLSFDKKMAMFHIFKEDNGDFEFQD